MILSYDTVLNRIPPTIQIVGIFSSNASGQKSVKQGLDNRYVPKKVNLPKSITKSLDKKITTSSEKIVVKNKVVTQEKIGNSINNLNPEPKTPALSQNNNLPDNQDFFEQFSEELMKSESEQNFQLEGEVVSRKIVNKVLPKYPDGLQKNAKVKLRFSLSPQGTVSNIVIIKRANPLLEKVSREAFAQWKFNPILSEQNQTGFITFVYQIK